MAKAPTDLLSALTTHPFMPAGGDPATDKLKEECGVVGVFGHEEAAKLAVVGLHALQHRGQEAAGIVTLEGAKMHRERTLGHVADYFTRPDVLDALPGNAAIGHVRYSTAGASVEQNIQPMVARLPTSRVAIAHNGNLTNNITLREELIEGGAIFQSTSDTENILHLIARSRAVRMSDKIAEALLQVEGAYSLVVLTNKKLVGVRDPLGVRPLVLGKLDEGYVLASETCALDIMGARFERDIEPGEMIIINEHGVESLYPFRSQASRFCIFEYVYFARADSVLEGQSVYEARKAIGRELAKEAPADVDVVVPVPDSGVPAALGYANETGIPFELGIIRNHYVGRTFIEPADQIRHLGVKLKHNANRSQIEGKRVLLVDDSIVRGTTSIKIAEMMREAGASEVHMRIASPPTIKPCYYGVDTPDEKSFLAYNRSVEEMTNYIKVDSLAFISIDGLYRAMGQPNRRHEQPQYCDACFTDEYPTKCTDLENGRDGDQLSFLSE